MARFIGFKLQGRKLRLVFSMTGFHAQQVFVYIEKRNYLFLRWPLIPQEIKILSIKKNQFFIFFYTRKLCCIKKGTIGCMNNQNNFPLCMKQTHCTKAPQQNKISVYIYSTYYEVEPTNILRSYLFEQNRLEFMGR